MPSKQPRSVISSIILVDEIILAVMVKLARVATNLKS